MFSSQVDPPHPFDLYATINSLEFDGKLYYFRKYETVLYVVEDKKPLRGERWSYNSKIDTIYKCDMDTNEILAFQTRLETREEKLKQIQAPLSGTKPIDFKSFEGITVLQHEYAVTNAASPQPILGSYGASSCLILALYNSTNKTAVLAHIDILTNIDSLKLLFYHFPKEGTVAHLIGGRTLSQEMCLNVVELLENQNIKIINAEIVVPRSYLPVSLAIDSRTGNIYSPVDHSQLRKTKDFQSRLMSTSLIAQIPLKTPLIELKIFPPVLAQKEFTSAASPMGEIRQPSGTKQKEASILSSSKSSSVSTLNKRRSNSRFSPHADPSHPFDFYVPINSLKFNGKLYYFRIYENVLYVVEDKKPLRGERWSYNSKIDTIFKCDMNADDILAFQARLIELKISPPVPAQEEFNSVASPMREIRHPSGTKQEEASILSSLESLSVSTVRFKRI